MGGEFFLGQGVWKDFKTEKKNHKGRRVYFEEILKVPPAPHLPLDQLRELVWLRGYTNLPNQSHITAPGQK